MRHFEVRDIKAFSPQLFKIFEYVSVILFSVEYITRIWSCIENPTYKKPLHGRLRYAITPLAIVDLLLKMFLKTLSPFFGIVFSFLDYIKVAVEPQNMPAKLHR